MPRPHPGSISPDAEWRRGLSHLILFHVSQLFGEAVSRPHGRLFVFIIHLGANVRVELAGRVFEGIG